jgi:uncharacterized protein YhfF
MASVALTRLESALHAAWGPDTCAPEDISDWTPQNPARGQCATTAVVVHDSYGGDLVRGAVHRRGTQVDFHWWNRLPDGSEIDLTRGQFWAQETIIGRTVVPRPTGSTRLDREYVLLKGRVAENLAADNSSADQTTQVVDHSGRAPQPLSVMEFAFPGLLRDALVASTLTGAKTTTTGLLAEYRSAGESLPAPGLRQSVVNSAGDVVGVIETTAVEVVRLADVPLQHALDEGEGHSSLALWRRAHEQFWCSSQFRETLDDPGFILNDDTEVVLERFVVIEKLEFVSEA